MDRVRDVVAAEDGSIVFSATLVRQMGILPGDIAHIDLHEDGSVVIGRSPANVTKMASEIEQIMRDQGVMLEDLLAGMEAARQQITRRIYGDAVDLS